MGFSIWFTAGGLVIRMDGRDDGVHWSRPKDFAARFPALALMGVVRPLLGIMGGIQTGPSEIVLISGGPGGATGSIRLDMATGAVIEFPAAIDAGLGLPPPLNGQDIVGIDRSTVLIRALDGWGFHDPVHDTFDGMRPYEEFGFTAPDGSQDLLNGSGKAVFVPGGELHMFAAFGFAGTYQVFDMNTRTTDGVRRLLSQDWPQLVESGMAPPEAAWLMTGDPEQWPAPQLTPDVSDGVLRSLSDAALGADVSPGVLLAVAYAESGMRTSAYHPSGRYGPLQLTADQLEAAGWADLPGNVLDAMPEELTPVLTAHLLNVGIPSDADEAAVWSSLLVPGLDLAADTVLGAVGGPREEVFASHGTADMDGDGVVTPLDLHRYIRSRRHEPRMLELRERLNNLF
ncbi:hypothetical protein [Streptomyces sp. NPDC048248]|uniref:hypothetical protein n=1 Tax=Streptomyces sp. NPDC048248 TaxID=3365523 RepID=UPI0037123549